MKTFTVSLAERSYPIYIGEGILDRAELYEQHIMGRQALVVTNEVVAPYYLARLIEQVRDFQVDSLVVPDGESYKTMESAMTIFDKLLADRYSRNATLIALGGGVIGDLAGFAAASYQRGIPFIQVPTTLLAQVDSSVGGKTAVNHPLGKNMIGAFYQPQCVIADTSVLATLPDRELASGIAEIVKYGLIRDPEFFGWLEKNMDKLVGRDPEALAFAIERSCLNKAEVVAADEKDTGERAMLNLGHTFGHAIEVGAGYGVYLHGEAVAIGICQAADLSRRLGWLNAVDVERIVNLLKRAGLPVRPPAMLGSEQFLEFMAVDKKNLNGKVRLILLKAIGEATLPLGVDPDELRMTLNHYGRD